MVLLLPLPAAGPPSKTGTGWRGGPQTSKGASPPQSLERVRVGGGFSPFHLAFLSRSETSGGPGPSLSHPLQHNGPAQRPISSKPSRVLLVLLGLTPQHCHHVTTLGAGPCLPPSRPHTHAHTRHTTPLARAIRSVHVGLPCPLSSSFFKARLILLLEASLTISLFSSIFLEHLRCAGPCPECWGEGGEPPLTRAAQSKRVQEYPREFRSVSNARD